MADLSIRVEALEKIVSKGNGQKALTERMATQEEKTRRVEITQDNHEERIDSHERVLTILPIELKETFEKAIVDALAKRSKSKDMVFRQLTTSIVSIIVALIASGFLERLILYIAGMVK